MTCNVVAKMKMNKNQSIIFSEQSKYSLSVDVTGLALQPARRCRVTPDYVLPPFRKKDRTTKYVCSGVILFFVNGGSAIAVVIINRFSCS